MAYITSYQSHFFLLSLLYSASQFTLSSSFPQQPEKTGAAVDTPTLDTLIDPVPIANASSPIFPRQEDDDDEDNRQSIVKNIGTILLGSLSLNPVKILKGALGFTGEDLQEHIFDPLLKLPSVWKQTTPTTPKARGTTPKSNFNGTFNAGNGTFLANSTQDAYNPFAGAPDGPRFPSKEPKVPRPTKETEEAPEDEEDDEHEDQDS